MALLWCVQAGVYWAHYASFYQCILSSNSVAAGVNKSLQSIIIFFGSSALWCGHDGKEAQCLTLPKAVSAVMVSGGVLLYAGGADAWATLMGGPVEASVEGKTDEDGPTSHFLRHAEAEGNDVRV